MQSFAGETAIVVALKDVKALATAMRSMRLNDVRKMEAAVTMFVELFFDSKELQYKIVKRKSAPLENRE